MQYKFKLKDGKIFCNNHVLHYVTRPTHEYVDFVMADGGTRTDYVNYDDERETYYAYDHRNSTRVPDHAVQKAIKAFEKGKTVFHINCPSSSAG